MLSLFHKPLARSLSVLLFEGIVGTCALYLAINFAFGRAAILVDLESPLAAWAYAVSFGVVAAAMAYTQDLHRSIWRFTSLFDLLTIIRSTTFAVAVFVPLAFLSTRAESLPRSAPIIAWFLTVALSVGARLAARLWAYRKTPLPLLSRSRSAATTSQVPMLLVGHADRIEAFLRELFRHGAFPYSVVGILTYETAWHGRHIHGFRVLGGRHELGNALAFLAQRKLSPQRLVIADDHADERTLSGFLDDANAHGLTLGRLPGLLDFSNPAARRDEVQPVDLADLLGRPQVVLDREAMRALITGRRVMITGAGGSIGSELVRQISDLQPARLVLLENCEFNLYSIDKELSERHPRLARCDALCDVRDRAALNRWFSAEAPEIVFHAAALKHVPLVESHPIQGVRTNVLGSQNVADACVQHGAAAMVLISTDKAVNPHNVMGATKRCAEAYCQALDAERGATRFVAVRFGNVLGSAGSVVPLFQRQLAAGGPLTVTHPEVTRYFMTIPEAVSLVLHASALGTRDGAGRGAVFVLDMGKPIKIADLARQLIRLSGKRPDVDVKIAFVGLRAGEKLHEELVHQEETASAATDGFMMVTPRTAHLSILKQEFADLAKAADALDEARVLRLLKLMVPEFASDDAPARAPVYLPTRAAGLSAVAMPVVMPPPEIPAAVPLHPQ